MLALASALPLLEQGRIRLVVEGHEPQPSLVYSHLVHRPYPGAPRVRNREFSAPMTGQISPWHRLLVACRVSVWKHADPGGGPAQHRVSAGLERVDTWKGGSAAQCMRRVGTECTQSSASTRARAAEYAGAPGERWFTRKRGRGGIGRSKAGRGWSRVLPTALHETHPSLDTSAS